MKKLVILLGFVLFLGWNQDLRANCDPATAALVMQPGRTFPVIRRDMDTGVRTSGTVTFNRGADACQGTITQSLDGAGAGIITEVAADVTANYRVVFTCEAQDGAGNYRLGSFVLVTPSAGASQTFTIIQKPNETIRIVHAGNISIIE